MNQLIRIKYREIFDPPAEELIEIVEEDGTAVNISLLPPLFLHAHTLTDPVFLEKLENFENDPISAFNDSSMQMYLFKFHRKMFGVRFST